MTAHTFNWKLRHNRVWRNVARTVGINAYTHTEDRRVLARVILPHLSGLRDVMTVLFVGCDWYTHGYRKFFARQHFWTIDVDPAKRKYGSKRHVTDCVTRIDRHFARGELDAVVCNGVFGWGLNDRDDVEKTFWALRRVMRPGALFVLGWNDVPARTPFPLSESESLRHYTPYRFPPLGTARFLTETPYRHTYDFYVR